MNNFADVEAHLAHCRVQGYDPVFYCVMRAPHVLVEILYMGYPINSRNTDGFSAIHMAFDKGDMASARTLLNAGADPTVISNRGFTIMHLAASRSRFDMLLLALDVYPEGIHVKDGKGVHPLAMAIEGCKSTGEVSDIVRELVNRGSIIDNLCIRVAMKARSSRVWRYLVAQGGRYDGEFRSPAEYTVMVDAVEACRRLALHASGSGASGVAFRGMAVTCSD